MTDVLLKISETHTMMTIRDRGINQLDKSIRKFAYRLSYRRFSKEIVMLYETGLVHR